MGFTSIPDSVRRSSPHFSTSMLALLLTFVLGQLDELGKYTVGAVRVQKGHTCTARAHSRLLVYELDAAFSELSQGFFEVVNLEGDVVKAFAPFGEELAHWRVRAGRLDEFDLRLPHVEHRGDYALLLDLFWLAQSNAKVLFVKAGRSGEILDRIAQVVDLFEQSSPFCSPIVEHESSPHSGSPGAFR